MSCECPSWTFAVENQSSHHSIKPHCISYHQEKIQSLILPYLTILSFWDSPGSPSTIHKQTGLKLQSLAGVCFVTLIVSAQLSLQVVTYPVLHLLFQMSPWSPLNIITWLKSSVMAKALSLPSHQPHYCAIYLLPGRYAVSCRYLQSALSTLLTRERDYGKLHSRLSCWSHPSFLISCWCWVLLC